MKPKSKILFALIAILTLGVTTQLCAQKIPAALNFTMKSIQGKDVKLSKYVGKVVVFVNVASKCGHTPQYEQLQKLHSDYADKGVAIIGVPCNQFLGQEPGTDKEILEFCQENYGVEFDLLAKVDVNGEKQCELYKHLNGLDLKPQGKGDVKWNFEKYILDRTGNPVARFSTAVKPDSEAFMAAVKQALGQADHYSHVSKKSGKTYYLFSKDIALKNSDKVRTIYYFAKDPNNAKGKPLAEVPEGKIVSETKTGLPVLKNKNSQTKK